MNITYFKQDPIKPFDINKKRKYEGYYDNGLPILMNEYEIQEKYKKITTSIEIVDSVSFIYNIDEQKILKHSETHTIIDNKLVIKPGNRLVFIKTYADPLPIEDINNSKKIIVYPHKIKNYRFIIVEEIK